MHRSERDVSVDYASTDTMKKLLCQLNLYRSQSEKLQKVNELYQRMAGVLDLSSMIETYSVWLAEHVDHELIGYTNKTRQRMHLFCSCHGSERRYLMNTAKKILHNPSGARGKNGRVDDLFSCQWTFEAGEDSGILLLLRDNGRISAEDLDLISESLGILADPLKRALDYEEIFEQARKDPLTGLPNRLVFEERVDCFIERARRHDCPLTLAALDLDHFKEVNDAMGHLMGDEVLKRVTASLQSQIRLTDLLIRMGGDEFLLLLPDTAMGEARSLAERLCLAIENLNIEVGATKLAVSIGLCQWHPGLTRKQWLEQADDILYQAKKNGRSQVAVQ